MTTAQQLLDTIDRLPAAERAAVVAGLTRRTADNGLEAPAGSDDVPRPSASADFLTPLLLLVAALVAGIGGRAIGWELWASVVAATLILLAVTFAADAVRTAAARPSHSRLAAVAESIRRTLAREDMR